ncbi:MAG: hypothetical protein ACLFO2_04350 [Candidatus Woesearchaeota archaeon]
MVIKEGKYTVESFARQQGLRRQSAINLLSKLRKQGLVTTSGGGSQKRIYTITNKPQEVTNGFYTLVNAYSPEKLVPKFKHRVVGKYDAERAIIDGILIGDARTLEATAYLFKRVKNWKRLFDLAKEKGVVEDVHRLYERARQTVKCKAMPKRYTR